jgi:hypothetical protein
MTKKINYVGNIVGKIKFFNLCKKIGKEKGLRYSDIFHEQTRKIILDGSRYLSRSVNEIVYTEAMERMAIEKEKTQKKLQKHLNNPHKIAEAIYTINKECKRMRDIASNAYFRYQYAKAGEASYKKTRLYMIKSEALNLLIIRENLTSLGYHTFRDGKERDLYVFGKYSFHTDYFQSKKDLGKINNNISNKKLRSMSLDRAKILLEMYINL